MNQFQKRIHNMTEMFCQDTKYIWEHREKYLKYTVRSFFLFLLGILTAHFFPFRLLISAFQRFLDLF